jgi:hypothetical protein
MRFRLAKEMLHSKITLTFGWRNIVALKCMLNHLVESCAKASAKRLDQVLFSAIETAIMQFDLKKVKDMAMKGAIAESSRGASKGQGSGVSDRSRTIRRASYLRKGLTHGFDSLKNLHHL